MAKLISNLDSSCLKTYTHSFSMYVNPCDVWAVNKRRKWISAAGSGMGSSHIWVLVGRLSLPFWKWRRISTSDLGQNLRFSARIIANAHVMGTQSGTQVPWRIVSSGLCGVARYVKYFLSAGLCCQISFCFSFQACLNLRNKFVIFNSIQRKMM